MIRVKVDAEFLIRMVEFTGYRFKVFGSHALAP